MAFCLIPKLADQFKQDLIDGKIDPNKLAEMTSEERRSFLAERLGGEEIAKEMNADFESKLLLKNKQLGYINWAKKMLGDKPTVLNDVVSKIQRMDERILNPETNDIFLKDLLEKKLGTEINIDEAKNIFELTQKIKEAESKITPNSADGGPEEMEYGAAVQTLKKYTDELKLSNREKWSPKDIIKHPIETLMNVGGFAKGLRATADLSAIGKQLWKVAPDSPGIYLKGVINSIKMMTEQLARGPESERVMDSIMARIYGSKEYRSGLLQRMKVDLGTNEEAFPVPLNEKIPVAGRITKASEVAYNGAIRLARFELAKKFARLAEENGINMNDSAKAKGVGQFANSLTGRGSLGKAEPLAKGINAVAFSAKNFVSNIDFATGFLLRKNVPTMFKVRAVRNLITAGATIYTLAKVINETQGKTVINTDPTSTNFLRMKIGGLYHDIMGGTVGPIILIARVIAQKRTSSTGKVTQLNTGKYGSETAGDLISQFFGNKLSPLAATLIDIMNRHDFNGNPVTPSSVLYNLSVPLTIDDIIAVRKSVGDDGTKLINNILNFSGFSGYLPYQKTTKPKQKKFQ